MKLNLQHRDFVLRNTLVSRLFQVSFSEIGLISDLKPKNDLDLLNVMLYIIGGRALSLAPSHETMEQVFEFYCGTPLMHMEGTFFGLFFRTELYMELFRKYSMDVNVFKWPLSLATHPPACPYNPFRPYLDLLQTDVEPDEINSLLAIRSYVAECDPFFLEMASATTLAKVVEKGYMYVENGIYLPRGVKTTKQTRVSPLWFFNFTDCALLTNLSTQMRKLKIPVSTVKLVHQELSLEQYEIKWNSEVFISFIRNSETRTTIVDGRKKPSTNPPKPKNESISRVTIVFPIRQHAMRFIGLPHPFKPSMKRWEVFASLFKTQYAPNLKELNVINIVQK